MKQIALLISILFFSISCMTIPKIDPKTTYTDDNSKKKISVPELNKEVTVNIGEELILSGLIIKFIQLSSPQSFRCACFL